MAVQRFVVHAGGEDFAARGARALRRPTVLLGLGLLVASLPTGAWAFAQVPAFGWTAQVAVLLMAAGSWLVARDLRVDAGAFELPRGSSGEGVFRLLPTDAVSRRESPGRPVTDGRVRLTDDGIVLDRLRADHRIWWGALLGFQCLNFGQVFWRPWLSTVDMERLALGLLMLGVLVLPFAFNRWRWGERAVIPWAELEALEVDQGRCRLHFPAAHPEEPWHLVGSGFTLARLVEAVETRAVLPVRRPVRHPRPTRVEVPAPRPRPPARDPAHPAVRKRLDDTLSTLREDDAQAS